MPRPSTARNGHTLDQGTAHVDQCPPPVVLMGPQR